jgi:hypothetical protein
MLVDGCSDRDRLLGAAAPLSEATTKSAHHRASTAIMTRLGLGRRRHVEAGSLHRILAALSEPAGRQLLAYVVARNEPMLAALAREVLYPHFVEHAAPQGFTAEEFSAINANGLFEVAGAVTHAGVAAYARRCWRIRDPSSTRRALRLLRKGGVLAATWIARGSRRCLGYFPIVGLPDIACFTYALYPMRDEAHYVRLDRLRAGLFVHLFLLRPVAVDYLIERAEELGLVQQTRPGLVDLSFASLEEATGAILQAHRAGTTP